MSDAGGYPRMPENNDRFFYNNCRLSSDMVYFLVIADKPQQHFTAAESYVVTWWPGDNSDQNVQSQETTGEYGIHRSTSKSAKPLLSVFQPA